MSMSAVLIVSLAAAVVLVVGGGLMMYMSNLVRNAYELKVQINADIEERIKAITDDMEKRTKWIKRDMIEELEKIKTGLTQANTRNILEMSEPLLKRIDAMELTLKTEHETAAKALEEMHHMVGQLDGKATQIRRDLRRAEDKLGIVPSSATPGLPSKQPAPGAPSAAGESPAAASAAAPKPTGAVEVSSVLPNL